MRRYLAISNLGEAATLGLVVTVMSIPRIHYGVQPGQQSLLLLAAFLSMTLTSGAAIAWSRYGGMVGLFPDRRTTLAGIGIAALVVLLMTPIMVFWVDPLMTSAMQAGGLIKMRALHFPTTPSHQVALILWSAGFETLFFIAGPMALFCRTLGSPILALGVAVSLRLFVSSYYLSQLNLAGALPRVMIGLAILTAIQAMLYARTGLIPAAVFSAGMAAHLFFL